MITEYTDPKTPNQWGGLTDELMQCKGKGIVCKNLKYMKVEKIKGFLLFASDATFSGLNVKYLALKYKLAVSSVWNHVHRRVDLKLSRSYTP